MAASSYAGNKLLDLLFRGVVFTPPVRVFVALHTADPGDSGTDEVSTADWPSYARQDPAGGAAIATGFSMAASKATTNENQMVYAAVDGVSNITVTHYAVWDAVTGGNCLHHGELTAAKMLQPTDELVIHAGELNISVA